MPRPARPVPSRLVDDWPKEASGDPSVEVARQLALRLRTVIGMRSTRQVKEETGVDHTTVAAILNGTVWPDLKTIARLEAGLGVDLWPAGVARSVAAHGEATR